jgi:L-histidine Nalpha-methyltransferase
MELAEMDELLAHIFQCGMAGDYLLIGADLDKDPAIIDRAYNDAAGYGARSTLNILSHLNRRYDGNFRMDGYAYRSRYNASARRNEVRIESLAPQTVCLRTLGVSMSFGRAETIEAEVMWKFDPQELARLLARAGFSLLRRWIEPLYQYGVFLLRHD